jgi:hypothetical protein
MSTAEFWHILENNRKIGSWLLAFGKGEFCALLKEQQNTNS